MRSALLLVVASACGAPPAMTVEAVTPASPVEEPAVVTNPTADVEDHLNSAELRAVPYFLPFEQRSTYFIVDANGPATRCVRYELDPSTTELRTRGLSISYEISADGLFTDCTTGPAPLAQVPEGVSVGSAIWFIDPIACERAVKAHRPVAMNFQCSRAPVVSSLVDQAAGASRLVAVATHGGSLYSIKANACQRISVVPSRQRDPHLLVGQLRWPVTSGFDGARGTFAVSYELPRTERAEFFLEGTRENDAMVLQAPVTTWRDGSKDDGPEQCVQLAFLELHRDRVVANDTLYFTAAGCRAAVAREAARATWFPPGQKPAVPETSVFDPINC